MKNNQLLYLGVMASVICSSNAIATDHTVNYKYDARGRLIKVADSNANKVYYTLDKAGNRLKVSNSTQTPTPTPVKSPVITSFIAPSSFSRAGELITVRWTSTDASYCALAVFNDYSDFPSLPTSGSQSLRLEQTSSVVVTCYNGVNSDSQGKIIRLISSGGHF